MDDFSPLWEEALITYRDRTGRVIDKDRTFSSIKSFDDLRNNIESKSEDFKIAREHHAKLYSSLSKWTEPLLPLLSLANAGIGSTPYAPIAIVFGAASHLIRASATVSKTFDSLEELFERIADVTTRLREYDVKDVGAPLRAKLTDLLALILEILGTAENTAKQKRFKLWMKLAFFEDTLVVESITKLKRYVESELGLVIVLILGQTSALQKTSENIRTQLEEVRSGISDMLLDQQNDRQRAFNEADEKVLTDCLDSSAVGKVYAMHARNMEVLTKGTSTWIVDDPLFQLWETEQATILWVFGKPGVGKTMLAARTIQTLQAKYPQHDATSLTSVSYVYFREGQPELQDCVLLWKAIALQMTRANVRFKRFVLDAIRQKPHLFASARQIWQDLFLDFFVREEDDKRVSSLAYLIIDGLDEAPELERARVLACLKELVKSSTVGRKCRIQVAIFCRPEVRADAGFEQVGSRRRERIIEITPERNVIDIEAYVKQRLGNIDILKALRKQSVKAQRSLARKIFTDILDRSQGMFLWASLVLDQLMNARTPEGLQSALEHVPQGLDNMLHHVFRRMSIEEEFGQSYLSDLLSWVFCAYRPLTVAELYILLQLTARQHCLMLENDVRNRYSSIFDVLGHETPENTEDDNLTEDSDESMSEDFSFLTSQDLEDDDDDLWASSEIDDEEQDAKSLNISPDSISSADKSNEFPDHWRKVTVQFSHARIHDYLGSEGHADTRRWHDCAVVPDNLDAFQFDVIHACIQLLKSGLSEKHELYDLRDYAAWNWMRHLHDMDLALVSKELIAQAAIDLVSLFSDGEVMRRFATIDPCKFMDIWFSNNKYVDVVRHVMSKGFESLDEAARPFVLEAQQSPAALFNPLFLTCAHVWLSNDRWDDDAWLDKRLDEVGIMHSFKSLNDVAWRHELTEDIYAGCSSVDQVEALAEMVTYEKTAQWHAAVGWVHMCLPDSVGTQKAIDHFQQALEKSPDGWVALEGLALCYGTEGQYTLAVSTMKQAIKALPEMHLGLTFYLRTPIGRWMLQMNQDIDATLEIAREAFLEGTAYTWGSSGAGDNTILDTLKIYFEALVQAKNNVELVKLILDLQDTSTYSGDESLLSVFQRAQTNPDHDVNLFEKVGELSRTTDGQGLVATMQAAAEQGIKLSVDDLHEDQLHVALNMGSFLFQYHPNIAESMAMYANVVTLIDQSKEELQQQYEWTRTSAANMLAQISILQLLSDDDGKDDARMKLEKLAKHEQGGDRYYRASYPALMLGYLIKEQDRPANEKIWKNCFKPSIIQALHLLSDNDPFNDQMAYCQLGSALLVAGDIHNASIALGITCKCIEDAKREQEESIVEVSMQEPSSSVMEGAETTSDHEGDDDTGNLVSSQLTEPQAALTRDEEGHNPEEANPEHTAVSEDGDAASNFRYSGFQTIWECDGPCKRESWQYEELHFCRICEDRCFCEKCIELVRTRKMPYRCCDSAHEHVKIFPLTDDARNMVDALLEKRFDVHEAWLSQLKKDWSERAAK